jgi:quinoprotein relay system zinc metallohydrolase 1
MTGRLIVAALLAAAGAAHALDYRLEARALGNGVYVVEGANADFTPANGCNIINTGFIATGAGVLVVNTGPSRLYGEQLRALIARTTREPVVQVLNLNLHPDYYFGNQAFAETPGIGVGATATTRERMQKVARSYEDNMYRLCGDWMKGTRALPPAATVQPGPLRIGTREFELRELAGHTPSDLVLIDKAGGVVFTGGLVFHQRIPTTPNADPKRWLASLDALAPLLAGRTVVPSHGPVHREAAGLAATRDYLRWLDGEFTRQAGAGADASDLLRADVPAPFRSWAAFPAEYMRNVAHLWPRYEKEALAR